VADIMESFLHEKLHSRRRRLEAAIRASRDSQSLVQLLDEVDSALARMNGGTYGLCEVCHESVEKNRLIADPLIRYCLDHLTSDQRRALEQDLGLASQIQRELLPKQSVKFGGWEVYYHYQPLGPVSGDFCDVVIRENDSKNLVFALGDVSGKGVTASMLMAHLHATFRTLVSSGLPILELVERASRIFCESTMSPHFVTLVCGNASVRGEIEVCNAGHCPALLLREGKVAKLEASGLPLGMFSEGRYSAQKVHLEPGETLFLHTDGLSEARRDTDEEYGEGRLSDFVGRHHDLPPRALVHACVEDLASFRSGAPLIDDLTIMAIGRVM